MEQNYFKCPNCNTITKHIKATAVEWSAQNNPSLLHIGVKMAEYSGLMKITQAIVGVRFWKCTNCLKILRYNEAGDVFEDLF